MEQHLDPSAATRATESFLRRLRLKVGLVWEKRGVCVCAPALAGWLLLLLFLVRCASHIKGCKEVMTKMPTDPS